MRIERRVEEDSMRQRDSRRAHAADTINTAVQLKEPDRFFYNQVVYLQRPLACMKTSSYGTHLFDKGRYVGVAGREAFHVFDLELMDFICADTSLGYVNCLEQYNR